MTILAVSFSKNVKGQKYVLVEQYTDFADTNEASEISCKMKAALCDGQIEIRCTTYNDNMEISKSKAMDLVREAVQAEFDAFRSAGVNTINKLAKEVDGIFISV